MESVATPEEFSVAVPNRVEPFRKLTAPVGTVAPLTVAIMVSAWPADTGFGVTTRVVVVAVVAGFTVTATAAEVLASWLPWPAYAAVKLYVPADRVVVKIVATPKEFSVPVPSTVEPFRKLTVPVGTVVPLTVAVRVNAWPILTGFGVATKLVLVAFAEAFTVTPTAAEVLARKLPWLAYTAVRL
jgi:hypothetical protein